MSLKNISLDPFILSQLYKAPIIASDSVEKSTEKQQSVSFLGNNRKQVSIFIHNDKNPWLPEDLFQLLSNILQACRMSMDDIALVNKARYPNKKLKEFTEALSPEKMIFLGDPFKKWMEEEGLEKNKVGFINEYRFLWSDSLKTLSSDKRAKKEFWLGLQQFFNLK